MGALTELLPIVRRKCPSVMDLMMLDALLDAYREFCRKSEYLALTQSIDPVTADIPTALVVPPEHCVLKVESVKESLTTGQTKELNVNDDYSLVNSGDQIEFNVNHDPVAVVYIAMPNATADPLMLEVSSDIINRYGDKISAGAAAKLRAQPSQPWTDFNLAEYYEREFTEGYREAYRDRRDSFATFRNKTRRHNFY